MAKAPGCPNCGGTLAALAVAGSPPWLCAECARAWWDAELSAEARGAWDSTTRSHGTGQKAERVRKAALDEHEAKDAKDRAPRPADAVIDMTGGKA